MKKQTIQQARLFSTLLMLFSATTFQASVWDIVDAVAIAKGLPISGGNGGGPAYIVPPVHTYIPFPAQVSGISITPMVGTTPGIELVFDAPTSTSIQQAIIQGHEVYVNLSQDQTGANIIATATDATLNQQIQNTVSAPASGVTSFVVNYTVGTRSAIPCYMTANIGQNVSLKSFVSVAVPATSTFSSCMFTIGGAQVPFGPSGLAAINTAIANGDNVLFAVELSGQNFVLTAKDEVTGTNLATASTLATSQTLPGYSIVYYLADTSTPNNVGKSHSLSLTGGQVVKVFSKSAAFQVPQMEAFSSFTMSYVAGSQPSTSFNLDKSATSQNTTLVLNSLIQNARTIFLSLESVANVNNTETIVVRVYDMNSHKVVTEKIIATGSSVSCTLTLTPNKSSALSSQAPINLTIGQGVVLQPVPTADVPSAKSPLAGKSYKRSQHVPTVSELTSCTTYQQLCNKLLEGTNTYINTVSDTTTSYPPNGGVVYLGLASNGVAIGQNPWPSSGVDFISFTSLPAGINWQTGVKFLLLEFDSNNKFISNPAKYSQIMSFAPSSLYLFVFDCATNKMLGSMRVDSSLFAMPNSSGQAVWGSNDATGGANLNNVPGKSGMYPLALNVNATSVVSSASGLMPTFVDIAAVNTLGQLEVLLGQTSGEQLNWNSADSGEQSNVNVIISGSSFPSTIPNAPAGYWQNNIGSFELDPYNHAWKPTDFGSLFWVNTDSVPNTNGAWPSVDWMGLSQLLNWQTGITLVLLAFDAKGAYLPSSTVQSSSGTTLANVTTTAPTSVFLFCFDTLSGKLLEISPFIWQNPTSWRIFNSSNLVTWNMPGGNSFNNQYNSTVSYPQAITFVNKVGAPAVPTTTTSVSYLAGSHAYQNPQNNTNSLNGLAKWNTYDMYSNFLNLFQSAGMPSLNTITLAGTSNDFSSFQNTNYPSDLTVLFGNQQSMKFVQQDNNIANSTFIPKGTADLRFVSARVTDWTQGMLLIPLAFDASGNLLGQVQTVPTCFYLFVYDVATQKRLGVISLNSTFNASALGSSWSTSAMTFQLGANNSQNSNYPAAVIVTGPASLNAQQSSQQNA